MPGRGVVKSVYAAAVDKIQASLRPYLEQHGFRMRGRTFNRTTTDGLTQVLGIQMGASDPPGTTYIPGLRENLHGLFTINLGVHVPEVALHFGGRKPKSWIQEYDCCVRARLAEACGEERDLWWHATADSGVVDDVRGRIETAGFPFLERYATRDLILAAWRGRSRNMGASDPPRIVSAMILAARAQHAEARSLLALQASESRATHPRHADYVQQLAERIGVGTLDG